MLLYNNTIISTRIMLFVLTVTASLLFFVSSIYYQTFAQSGFTLEGLEPIERGSLLSNLTDKELVNQTKEKGEALSAVGETIAKLFVKEDEELGSQAVAVNETRDIVN